MIAVLDKQHNTDDLYIKRKLKQEMIVHAMVLLFKLVHQNNVHLLQTPQIMKPMPIESQCVDFMTSTIARVILALAIATKGNQSCTEVTNINR